MAHSSGYGMQKLVVYGGFQAVQWNTFIQKRGGNSNGIGSVRISLTGTPTTLQSVANEDLKVFGIGDIKGIKGLITFFYDRIERLHNTLPLEGNGGRMFILQKFRRSVNDPDW